MAQNENKPLSPEDKAKKIIADAEAKAKEIVDEAEGKKIELIKEAEEKCQNLEQLANDKAAKEDQKLQGSGNKYELKNEVANVVISKKKYTHKDKTTFSESAEVLEKVRSGYLVKVGSQEKRKK